MGQQVNGSSKVKSPSESDWTSNLINKTLAEVNVLINVCKHGVIPYY